MDYLRQSFSEHLKNAEFKEFEAASHNGCSVNTEWLFTPSEINNPQEIHVIWTS